MASTVLSTSSSALSCLACDNNVEMDGCVSFVPCSNCANDGVVDVHVCASPEEVALDLTHASVDTPEEVALDLTRASAEVTWLRPWRSSVATPDEVALDRARVRANRACKQVAKQQERQQQQQATKRRRVVPERYQEHVFSCESCGTAEQIGIWLQRRQTATTYIKDTALPCRYCKVQFKTVLYRIM